VIVAETSGLYSADIKIFSFSQNILFCSEDEGDFDILSKLSPSKAENFISASYESVLCRDKVCLVHLSFLRMQESQRDSLKSIVYSLYMRGFME